MENLNEQRVSLSSLRGHFGDVVKLSGLFLLYSLPVVTYGASAAALYFAAVRTFRLGEKTPVEDFKRSFRENFKQGTILTSIALAYLALMTLALCAVFGGIGSGTRSLPLITLALTTVVPPFFALPYLFPYIARFYNSTADMVRNSLLISMSHPLHTLGLWIAFAVSAALCAFIPLAFVVPCISALLLSSVIEDDIVSTRKKVLAIQQRQAAQNGDTVDDADGSADDADGDITDGIEDEHEDEYGAEDEFDYDSLPDPDELEGEDAFFAMINRDIHRKNSE